MIIYPAIDLRGGKVVRLREGDPKQQTTFSDDPLQTAQQWMDQGATWLHMVNLDGAFAEANDNSRILEGVAKIGLKVQFGGGLRSLDMVAQVLDQGAARAVIGTLALQNPEVITEAVERFGAEKICIALDAKNGKIATHGWQTVTDQTPVSFGKAMAEKGVQHALYTDVKRDGSLQGANLEDTITLAQETGLKVIASGGITTLEEIRTLARSQIVAGAIIGMALYEGRINLADALQAAKETDNAG